jgi:hypothetical protein
MGRAAIGGFVLSGADTRNASRRWVLNQWFFSSSETDSIWADEGPCIDNVNRKCGSVHSVKVEATGHSRSEAQLNGKVE